MSNAVLWPQNHGPSCSVEEPFDSRKLLYYKDFYTASNFLNKIFRSLKKFNGLRQQRKKLRDALSRHRRSCCVYAGSAGKLESTMVVRKGLLRRTGRCKSFVYKLLRTTLSVSSRLWKERLGCVTEALSTQRKREVFIGVHLRFVGLSCFCKNRFNTK